MVPTQVFNEYKDFNGAQQDKPAQQEAMFLKKRESTYCVFGETVALLKCTPRTKVKCK